MAGPAPPPSAGNRLGAQMKRIDDSQTRRSNPIAQVLGLIAALVLLVIAVTVGAFLLAALLGLLALTGLVLYVRLWWLRRQWQRRRQRTARSSHGSGRIIEGEYVSERPSTRKQEHERR